MERRHGTVHEMGNQRHEDQGDEKAPEKEFAGMPLIVIEEQVVHGEIDAGHAEKVPREWLPVSGVPWSAKSETRKRGVENSKKRGQAEKIWRATAESIRVAVD